MIKIPRIILTNAPLKIIALLVGCALWSLLSSTRFLTKTFTIPIAFYNQQQEKIIQSPDTIRVTLGAKRADFKNFDETTLAIHLDCEKITLGKHAIKDIEKYLFLPGSIKLVNYKPSNLVITCKKA